jgi:dipeptidyl aminopeptidase/acylaminoacyl peptidase
MKHLAFFLLLLCPQLRAQTFGLEQILGAPFPTAMTASPSGEKIAWVYNKEGSRNIWIAEGADFKTKPITRYTGDDGQEIGSLTFAPDGRALVFVRGGAPNGAGDLPNPAALQEGVDRALWVCNADGGGLHKIGKGFYPKISPRGETLAFLSGGQVWSANLNDTTPAKKMFSARGSLHSIRWSPDGGKLAFVSGRGDHSFVGVYDLAKKEVQFLDPSVDFDQSPVWSPDGARVAFIRVPFKSDNLIFIPEREAEPWSIRVAELNAGRGKEVWKAAPGRGSAYFSEGLVADNKLFWTADNALIFAWEGDGWHHLYSVSPEGGSARLLTPGAGEVEYAILSADQKSVLCNANIGDIDRRHLWQVSANGPARQLTRGTGIEWAPAQTAGGQIALLRSDARLPARAALLQPDGTLRDLAPELLPADFPAARLVEPQAVTITAADGMSIPCQLFLPPGHKAGEKHPAAIFFHGGSRRQMLLGFNYGNYYHNAYALNQYLASKGYVVLSVNFRSGIGYGMEFREALQYGASGASEFNDVLGAGFYLKNRADVDARRIGLWGGSYGGFMTAMGLAKAPDLFAAGVDIHGAHDWNVIIKNFVPSYDPLKNPELAKLAYASSPMPYVQNWKAPVLLIHGDDDRNVPFSETVTLAEQLRKNKVYFEQLVLTDEVHGFLLHQNWLKAYRATADFFDRFVKGRK